MIVHSTMNLSSRPPPELTGANVLEFAIIDATVTHDPLGPYMVVDGVRLGSVPCLVIARNQYAPSDVLLFFCDAEWDVLAAAGYETVAEAKVRADKEYRGIHSLWQPFGGE